MYYKSYHDQMTTEEIMNTFIIGQNGELDPTGLRQDCLGMTPLHILACSTVPCLELFQLMVEKYPENLIVKESWGGYATSVCRIGERTKSDCSFSCPELSISLP